MANSVIRDVGSIAGYGTNVTNVNTLFDTGVGYTSAATGVPSGAGNGTIVVFRAGTVTLQLYFPYSPTTKPQYRTYVGSWTAWHTLY